MNWADNAMVRAFFSMSLDLLELNGCDLRRGPIEARKVELAKLLHKAKPGLRLASTSKGTA
jgi:hypothetical protein